MKTQYV